jgi:hypothetical protein
MQFKTHAIPQANTLCGLGLSNSLTSSVETCTLGMDHTFSTTLPSSSVSHVETMVSIIFQDNIVKIHEDISSL